MLTLIDTGIEDIVASQLYSRTFASYPNENPFSDGGLWSYPVGTDKLEVSSGILECNGLYGGFGVLSDVLSQDCYCISTISNLSLNAGGSASIALALRLTSGFTAGVQLTLNGFSPTPKFTLGDSTGKSYITSETPIQFVNGDSLGLFLIGSNWYVTLNGVVVFKGTEAALFNNHASIACIPSSAITTAQVSAFSCGNLGRGAVRGYDATGARRNIRWNADYFPTDSELTKYHDAPSYLQNT